MPHARRNFILFFLDYAIFGIGFSMIGNTTVVPDLVRHLTDSETIIGLAGALYPFAWLVPQLLFAQVINRSTRRKPFMTWSVIPFASRWQYWPGSLPWLAVRAIQPFWSRSCSSIRSLRWAMAW